MYKPLVSIITATWNRGDIIHLAIESVLNQTYDNWELIIVLDGCTDNTLEVVRGYKDDRIKVFNEEKFPYYTDVRNFGIEHSKGELLCYHDDDHIMLPTYLEELVKPHKADDVAVTYVARKEYKDVNLRLLSLSGVMSIEPSLLPPMKYHAGKESLSGVIDAGDMMHKRSVFSGDFQGFRPSSDERDYQGYCSDAKLIDDIEKNNPQSKFILVPKRLSLYFLDHGAITKNMTRRKIEGREKGELVEEDQWKWG